MLFLNVKTCSGKKTKSVFPNVKLSCCTHTRVYICINLMNVRTFCRSKNLFNKIDANTRTHE